MGSPRRSENRVRHDPAGVVADVRSGATASAPGVRYPFSMNRRPRVVDRRPDPATAGTNGHRAGPRAASREAPLVSAIVAAYNGAAFLRESLDSILAQDWPRLEVIVCDDGSTDDTPAILASYGDRLHVLRQPNRGVAAARNRAAAEARGDYLAFLDQDDCWEAGMLGALVPVLEQRPELGLVYADSWVTTANGARRGRRGAFLSYAEGDVFSRLLHDNFIPIESTVFRTRVFRELGGFDEALRLLEDYELCLRISRRWRVAHHPEALARYRIHDGNLSHDIVGILREFVDVLEQVPQVFANLSDEDRATVEYEVARRCAELAWQLLRRRELGEAGAFMGRAASRPPTWLAWKVRVGQRLLTTLPEPLADRLLRMLPRRKLYGIRGRA